MGLGNIQLKDEEFRVNVTVKFPIPFDTDSILETRAEMIRLELAGSDTNVQDSTDAPPSFLIVCVCGKMHFTLSPCHCFDGSNKSEGQLSLVCAPLIEPVTFRVVEE